MLVFAQIIGIMMGTCSAIFAIWMGQHGWAIMLSMPVAALTYLLWKGIENE